MRTSVATCSWCVVLVVLRHSHTTPGPTLLTTRTCSTSCHECCRMLTSCSGTEWGVPAVNFTNHPVEPAAPAGQRHGVTCDGTVAAPPLSSDQKAINNLLLLSSPYLSSPSPSNRAWRSSCLLLVLLIKKRFSRTVLPRRTQNFDWRRLALQI